MTMAPIGPTKPQAGVIATRPATAPEAAPSIEGLPLQPLDQRPGQRRRSGGHQVLTKASAAKPLASSAEPALKPNQPTHSSEAPIMVMVRLCGAIASLP
jgi:hypothetical protein